MRDVDSLTTDALLARAVVARDLFKITAKLLSDSTLHTAYYWNGLGPLTCDVISGDTGATESRTHVGSGTLIQAGDIALTSDLTIHTVDISLNYTNVELDTYIRTYSLKKAPIEIHRALFSTVTGKILTTPWPRFVGFVSTPEIIDPQVGSPGSVTLGCVSHSRELTRTSSAKRSNADQNARAPGDKIYQYTAVMGSVPVFWGQAKSTPSSIPAIPANTPQLVRILLRDKL